MHYVGGRIHTNIHSLTKRSLGLFNSHARMTWGQNMKILANAYMEFLSALLVLFGLFDYGKGKTNLNLTKYCAAIDTGHVWNRHIKFFVTEWELSLLFLTM